MSPSDHSSSAPDLSAAVITASNASAWAWTSPNTATSIAGPYDVDLRSMRSPPFDLSLVIRTLVGRKNPASAVTVCSCLSSPMRR